MLQDSSRQNILTHQAGASLLEMLVGIIVLGLVAVLAVPQMGVMQNSFNRFNARAQLLEDIKFAQAHSITEGCRGIFSISSSGKDYTFGCDYLDYDIVGVPEPDSVILNREIPGDVTISASAIAIFNSRGQSIDQFGMVTNVTFTLNSKIKNVREDFASGLLLGTGVFKYV